MTPCSFEMCSLRAIDVDTMSAVQFHPLHSYYQSLCCSFIADSEHFFLPIPSLYSLLIPFGLTSQLVGLFIRSYVLNGFLFVTFFLFSFHQFFFLFSYFCLQAAITAVTGPFLGLSEYCSLFSFSV